MDAIAPSALPKPSAAASRLRSSSSTVRPTTVVLEVSTAVFRCVWISILVVRCVSVVYLLASAALYFFLAQPTMVYYASLLGAHAPPQLLPMAAFLAVLALAQLYRVVTMVFYSCVSRELLFVPPSVSIKTQSNAVVPLSGTMAAGSRLSGPNETHTRLPWLGRVGHAWSSMWGSSGGAYLWRLLFGRQGFFSIKSEYFEIRLALREFVEILSQTLQLHKASKLLVKHWVTDLFASIVVVNCWSTPVVQFHCRNKVNVVQQHHKTVVNVRRSGMNNYDRPRRKISSHSGFERQLQGVLALERLLCVAIDVVLDLGTSIVIPAIILYPYVQQFNLSTFSFNNEMLYDDIRFVGLVYEMQQVLATTPVEAILAVFPHWGIYAGCGNVKTLLIREKRPDQADIGDADESIVRVRLSVSGQVASAPPASRIKSSIEAIHRTSGAFLKRTPTWIRTGRKRIVDQVRRTLESDRVHLMFFLWGLAVLSLHISSALLARHHESSRPPGCKQALRPWLTDKTACAVFEFNCYLNQSVTVTESDFDQLERDFLAVLILSHCSALVVPRSIREFPNLLGFETYNSTIVQWNRSSSFSVGTQSRLAYVLLLRTKMSSFPEGLVGKLPTNLLDVEISISNLTALPDDLDRHWHPMAVLYVEYTAISSFPVALTRLLVADLSLVGNQISTLTDVDWSRTEIGSLSLAHNPIEQLSSTPIGNLKELRTLLLEGTAIYDLPAWVIEASRARNLNVYLKDSPFCQEQANKEAAQRFGAGAFVTCVDHAPRSSGAVPIEFIASHRPLIRDLPGGVMPERPAR